MSRVIDQETRPLYVDPGAPDVDAGPLHESDLRCAESDVRRHRYSVEVSDFEDPYLARTVARETRLSRGTLFSIQID